MSPEFSIKGSAEKTKWHRTTKQGDLHEIGTDTKAQIRISENHGHSEPL